MLRNPQPPGSPRPRAEPWNPAGNTAAEGFVFRSKRSLERWLLIGKHEQVETHPDKGAIFEHAHIRKNQALARYDRHDSDVHRIADIPIKPSDHQVTCRENRRGCAQSFDRKPNKRIRQHQGSRRCQHASEDLERKPPNARRRETPPGNPPRHETGNHAWREHQKDGGSEDGERSPHYTDSMPGQGFYAGFEVPGSCKIRSRWRNRHASEE